jgi:predicted TIM-barrel fold metal-dependent hydrolase
MSSAAAGGVDTHVHVFRRGGAFAPDRRYTPEADAPPETLLTLMDHAGIERAVLVQPSFLGTDNSFLLEAIAASPARLSGVAVVDPDISMTALERLRSHGVFGVRLNCIGAPAPDFGARHKLLLQRLADARMVLQIQAEGSQWLALERTLSDPPLDVVIDHFGRTAPGHDSGGFECLMHAARRTDRLWFKFSAPYRLAPGAADACAAAVLEIVGVGRVLWGSDWPHTQHEGQFGYGGTLAWLEDWIRDPDDRRRVLQDNPRRLMSSLP